MDSKKAKTKENKLVFGRTCGCAFVDTETEKNLTDQPQWKTVVSNFTNALNEKFPPKTKAITPQGLKVK